MIRSGNIVHEPGCSFLHQGCGNAKPAKSIGFRDVRAYRSGELRLVSGRIGIPVSYRNCWDDGYGARGWKPDLAIGNPAIMASTRQSGDVIQTSVLVHDLLDHIVSGFAMSGHRAEAMASHQLGLRTGSDVHRDYLQLVLEDLRFGRVNGESMVSFLPPDLVERVPTSLHGEDEKVARFLRETIGEALLIQRLNERMAELGRQGEQHARNSWAALGLNKDIAAQTGLQLQALLNQCDRQAEAAGVDRLKAVFWVADYSSSIELIGPSGKLYC